MVCLMGSIGILLGPILMVSIFIPIFVSGITYYHKNIDLDSSEYEPIYSDSLHEFIQDLGEEGYIIYSTDSESGAGIYRLFKPNVYIVPEHTNPKQGTRESKAVIAHEFSHMKSKDNLKITVVGNILIFILALPPAILSNIAVLAASSVIGFFLAPLVLNYLHHRSEYRADSFASRKVGVKAVQNRLRRNTHLHVKNYEYIPYSETHPDVESRMHEITRMNEINNKDQQ